MQCFTEEQVAMMTSHHDAMQRAGTALGLQAGSNIHNDIVPAINELKRQLQMTQRGYRMNSEIIENHGMAMAAALIEAQAGRGLRSGLQWIYNTLWGPGLLPNMDEAQQLGGAQAWFDAKMAESEARRGKSAFGLTAADVLEPDEPTALETIVACLDDDAAAMRHAIPDDERAANMHAASQLLLRQDEELAMLRTRAVPPALDLPGDGHTAQLEARLDRLAAIASARGFDGQAGIEGALTALFAAHEALKAQLQEMEARKDAAYLERNQVVAALAKAFPSGVARTAIEGWSEDWHGCVYIDLPTGQASWHFHDSQAYLFDGLPAYQGTWDGHDTPEKYRRLAAIALQPAAAPNLTTCNCRWDGDQQVQQCTLHQAHVDAVHEWAGRAKEAEAKLTPSLPLPIIQALRFYANGSHYHDDPEENFDSVSGEPDNWQCSGLENSQTMFEDGTVARMVLQGKPLGWLDGGEDTQPKPVEGEVFTVAVLTT